MLFALLRPHVAEAVNARGPGGASVDCNDSNWGACCIRNWTPKMIALVYLQSLQLG